MEYHYEHTLGPGSDGAFCACICWIGAEPGEESYRCDQHHLKCKRELSLTSPFLFLSMLFDIVASTPSIYAVKITLKILLPTRYV